ncbi:hypothetical protein [Micromonospora sp. NPDC007220]|uniref:hypothetical protein n=1 Tax=Micromonospora sp. NPDC007220 TaxID=3154318 RepID=UPI00340FABC7
MWIANLEMLVNSGPELVLAAIGLPVAGKLIALAVATRGADPKDRPNIIKAVAELFRWRR